MPNQTPKEESWKNELRQSAVWSSDCTNIKVLPLGVAERIVTLAVQTERERIANLVLPKAQKFIAKVESGRAKSKETYADMKELVALLTPPSN